VRHVEAVAPDRQVVPRARRRLDRRGADRGEALGLVVLEDVGDADVAAQRRERVVERDLIRAAVPGRPPNWPGGRML
jgi:hypothetical protein